MKKLLMVLMLAAASLMNGCGGGGLHSLGNEPGPFLMTVYVDADIPHTKGATYEVAVAMDSQPPQILGSFPADAGNKDVSAGFSIRAGTHTTYAIMTEKLSSGQIGRVEKQASQFVCDEKGQFAPSNHIYIQLGRN